MVDINGGVHAFGDATVLPDFPAGSGYTSKHDGFMTAAARTPTGAGLFGLDQEGHVWTLGDARPHGDASRNVGSASAIAIATTPTGNGYWIADSRGGVYSFGDATFHGSMGGRATWTITGLAATRDGGGYWLVDYTGSVTAFGDATLESGTATEPRVFVTGIAADTDSSAYYVIHGDGHVDVFGSPDAPPPAPDGAADLAVAVGARDRVPVGGALQYQVKVTNSGPATAVAPVVTLSLPPRFAVSSVFQSGRLTGQPRLGQQVRWRLPDLAPGARATLLVTGTARTRAGVQLCSTASIASPRSTDPHLRNNSELTCTTVRAARAG